MAIANNHKMTLLYMLDILYQRTDEEHPLNAAEMIQILHGLGCEADRRTIYSNIEVLREFGVDVIKAEGTRGYYVGSREFELSELKLLVDAVQSSKFITEKKSKQLIGKLMNLTSRQKAKELDRAVYISNRLKTGNEKIYYNIDALHEAMNHDHQIQFQYGEWNTDKVLVAKKDGRKYIVSPWELVWDNENYYLIGYDENDGKIKHFRVDKMLGIGIGKKKRNGREEFSGFDMAAFTKKTFGMYGGKDAEVMLRCENHLAGVIIDRFGSDIMLIPDGDSQFRVHVKVAVSPQFFGWVTGIGEGIVISSPTYVREEYQTYLRQIIQRYGG